MTPRARLRFWYGLMTVAIILTVASAVLFLVELVNGYSQPWGALITTVVGVLLLIVAVGSVRALRRQKSS